MIAAQHKIANSIPAVYVARLRDYAINKMEFGKNVVVGSDQSHWNYEDIVSIGKDFMRLFYDVDGKLVYSASVRLDGSDSAKKELPCRLPANTDPITTQIPKNWFFRSKQANTTP